jgi:predicted esterase
MHTQMSQAPLSSRPSRSVTSATLTHAWSRRIAYWPLLAALFIASSGVRWYTPVSAHVRTALLIAQVFPQVPIKPLELVSRAPIHQVQQLSSAQGAVVADLFLPTPLLGDAAPRGRSALILAMGVKTAPKDRPALLELGSTFARLGFVVIWPRRQSLDDGLSLPEEPGTFVEGARYLRTLEQVDQSRITLLGFSTGASIGLIAASKPEIADAIHSVIFFGGYYDIHTYLLSLASATIIANGEATSWQPAGEAVGHMREILANVHAPGLLRAFEASTPQEAAALLDAAPRQEVIELERFSPSLNTAGFRGRLFILHDTGDPLVPYVESDRLYHALSSQVETTYAVTSLFDHVQPKNVVTWDALAQGLRLYGFLEETLAYV